MGEWHPSGQEVEKTTPGPTGVGTIWKVTGQLQGRAIEMSLRVTKYDPNREFGFRTAGPIQAQQTFTFDPVAGETGLVTVLELDAELAPVARQRWEEDLLTLNELLEAQV